MFVPDEAGGGAGGSARSTEPYLQAVASADPTPGGGSVAAIMAALAAALGEMVCRLTGSRAERTDMSEEIAAALSRFSGSRESMLALAVADEAAYAAFRSAAALPRSSLSEKAERTEAMQAALVGAALVPLATARASRDLLPDIAYVAVEGNRHLRSDALIAAILADAAVRSCAINVRVNTAMLRDKARASELDAEVEAIVADSSDLLSRVV